MLLGIGSRRDPRSCQDQFFSVELPAEIASCLAPKIQPHSPPTDAKKSRNVGQFGRGSGEIFWIFWPRLFFDGRDPNVKEPELPLRSGTNSVGPITLPGALGPNRWCAGDAVCCALPLPSAQGLRGPGSVGTPEARLRSGCDRRGTPDGLKVPPNSHC